VYTIKAFVINTLTEECSWYCDKARKQSRVTFVLELFSIITKPSG
jgi:hypothetical protein